jgi:hypothetical protein
LNQRHYWNISKHYLPLLPISVSMSNWILQSELKMMCVRSITDKFEPLSIAISTKTNFSFFLCWLLFSTQTCIIFCTWIVVTVIIIWMIFNCFLKKSYKLFVQLCPCFFVNQSVIPEFIVNNFISFLLLNELFFDLKQNKTTNWILFLFLIFPARLAWGMTRMSPWHSRMDILSEVSRFRINFIDTIEDTKIWM